LLQSVIQLTLSASDHVRSSYLRHDLLSPIRQIVYSALVNFCNGNRASPASGPSNPQRLEVFLAKTTKTSMGVRFFPIQRSVSMLAPVRNKGVERINGSLWSKELCAVVR